MSFHEPDPVNLEWKVNWRNLSATERTQVRRAVHKAELVPDLRMAALTVGFAKRVRRQIRVGALLGLVLGYPAILALAFLADLSFGKGVTIAAFGRPVSLQESCFPFSSSCRAILELRS